MLTPVSPRSLDRYINFWLPLVAREVADNDTTQLIPPPDVAWLWHCHRLAPMNYERYVRNRFKSLLEATPSFSFQSEDDDNTDSFLTRDSWYNAFPDEPFFLQDTEIVSSDITAETIIQQCRSLEGFDLLSSTQNQATFLWQVSGPKFREDAFFIKPRRTTTSFSVSLPPEKGVFPWCLRIRSISCGTLTCCGRSRVTTWTVSRSEAKSSITTTRLTIGRLEALSILGGGLQPRLHRGWRYVPWRTTVDLLRCDSLETSYYLYGTSKCCCGGRILDRKKCIQGLARSQKGQV